jgi:hypothetical protein
MAWDQGGKEIVGIDVDGTIAPFTHYRFCEWDDPDPEVVDAIRRKWMDGAEILIFSARCDAERGAFVKYCEKHEIPWHRIQFGKPVFDVLLDDRATAFQIGLKSREIVGLIDEVLERKRSNVAGSDSANKIETRIDRFDYICRMVETYITELSPQERYHLARKLFGPQLSALITIRTSD